MVECEMHKWFLQKNLTASFCLIFQIRDAWFESRSPLTFETRHRRRSIWCNTQPLFSERWPSGLRRRSRKPLGDSAPRGFESHPLRNRFQTGSVLSLYLVETGGKSPFFVSNYRQFFQKIADNLNHLYLNFLYFCADK